jgi:peroxiredoxin
LDKLEFLKQIKTQKGDTLWDLSYERPVLVVFLRHFGCVFCKEALTELGKIKDKISGHNTHLVLVHLADPQTAESFFSQYGLDEVDFVTDPEAIVYQQFGLLKGRLHQMMGLKVWLRTFQQGVVQGHGLSSQLIGDGFQMPGVFLLFEGEIKDKFIHHTIADKPDYLKLADCIACKPN